MPSSITLTVSHLPTSTSFFLGALQPLKYVYRGRVGNTIGFGYPDAPPDFWISQETPGVPAGAAHVAFPATSQKNVQDFFFAALKAGGKVHGEPACRDLVSGYYSAAVIDFDGNSIEAVFRPDLVAESSDESRPSSISSLGSVASKSSMSQKAPTVASKASTAKPRSQAPTEARSAAPSKSPTQVSKAPSRAPTSASRAPSQQAPTEVSKAPSRAPTQASQAPSSSPRAQTSITLTPDGQTITNFMSEARGAVAVARELASHVRPVLSNTNSAPAVPSGAAKDLQSHQPSDTIVGTLLGVAAGAALHYAYTKATKSPPLEDQQERSSRPLPARTSTEPSFFEPQRQYYYHEHGPAQPYAIEAGQSEYSDSPRSSRSQRYITMEDHDDRLSNYTKATPTAMRPRRRSSFSGIGSIHTVTESRASRAGGGRLIEAPPTSYKAPTAVTQADTQASGRSSSRSRSKSRVSSVLRAASLSSSNRRSRHGSDEDLRSSAPSQASRRTSTTAKPHGRSSRAPSVDGRSEARTVVPSKSGSSSKPPSRAPSRSSRANPEAYPLPPSRAGTWAGGSETGTSFFSTHSKEPKTVIGRMIEKDRKKELATKSVIGKMGEVNRLDLTDEEVGPADSVSQVSSNRTGRSSRR